MVTLRAHFDGRVLVPECPVDLPRGRVLEIRVEEVGENIQRDESVPIFDMVNGMPVVRVPAGARPITLEDIRLAEEDW